MPHTMHAIQTNQGNSHHRVLKRFTEALPSMDGTIQETVDRSLRQIVEDGEKLDGKCIDAPVPRGNIN